MALLALAASGALDRPAGADTSCKPNRATCRKDVQCCSGICAAGLCAAPATTTSTSSTSTTTTTPPTVCGAGTVLVGNECQPDYAAICGTGTQLVAGQCLPEVTPPPSCGDGNLDPDEECDDGNVITEAECPYGEVICNVCAADCTFVERTGPFCGDGIVTNCEVCDDGNPSCGTCGADCRELFQLASATGWILAVDGASLVDGETFTLDDGMGTVAAFEFDLASDGVENGNTAIDVSASDPADLVANRIRVAIINSALQIDAERINNLVTLVNQHQSNLGNKPISETVSNADFLVTGMQGGAGGDCLLAEECGTDGDCASGLCESNMCAQP
jgi:cysteine-rich repeat protein